VDEAGEKMNDLEFEIAMRRFVLTGIFKTVGLIFALIGVAVSYLVLPLYGLVFFGPAFYCIIQATIFSRSVNRMAGGNIQDYFDVNPEQLERWKERGGD
jgi:hypothetical protein